MVSGDLNRIESAFAEATLDSGLWSRALNPTEIGSFGTARLALGGVTIPGDYFRSGWCGRSGPMSGRDGESRQASAQRNRAPVGPREHAIRHASVDAATL